MEQAITYLLIAVAVYVVMGILFILFFLWKGLKKVDESTNGTGVGFKLLIFPGLVAFWPVFLNKWMKINRL